MIEARGCPQTLSGKYFSWLCLWRVMRRKALAPRGELPTRTAEPPCALLTASGVKWLGRQVLKMPRGGVVAVGGCLPRTSAVKWR